MKYLPPVEPEKLEANGSFDFQQLLQTIREKWWLVALFTIVFAALGAVYDWKTPIIFQARAVLQVDQEEKNLLSVEEVSEQDLRATEVLNSLVQNARNSSVMLRVVRTNQLASNPRFLPKITNQLSETKLAHALAGMVTAKLRPETRLIDITVVHSDPALAQKLANSVAEEFIRQNMDERFSSATAANELLLGEANKLKEKLGESERKILDYKEENRTVSLEDRQKIVIEKLKALNQRYAEAKSDRLQLEADLEQARQLTNQPERLLTLPGLLQDPVATDLRRKIVETQAQVDALSLRYKPKYPEMILARQQLDDVQAALRGLAMEVPRWVESAYDRARAREDNFASGLKEVEGESLDLDKKSIQYNVLLREVQSDRALYEAVLKRLKETDLSKGLERTSIAMVEPAGWPGGVKPSRNLIIIAASVVGTLMGLGLVYLLKIIDHSIRTVDQAEGLLSLPVLAAIPVSKSCRNGKPPHLLAEEPASICSEGFRTLRTSTGLLLREGGKKTVLFTSADPAEGKTFFSVNHAICQAQAGERTLLIDLDLRRPTIGACFGLPPDAPGVAEYLSGGHSLDDLVQPTSYPNLFILPAGRKIARPAEELGRDSVRQLLGEAGQGFERVIIDTPPINAVSDTLLLLRWVDVVCLVVRAGRTSRRAVMRAVELMARAEAPPSGVVLNCLPRSSGFRNYYYYAPEDGYYSAGVYSGNQRGGLLGTGNGNGRHNGELS